MSQPRSPSQQLIDELTKSKNTGDHKASPEPKAATDLVALPAVLKRKTFSFLDTQGLMAMRAVSKEAMPEHELHITCQNQHGIAPRPERAHDMMRAIRWVKEGKEPDDETRREFMLFIDDLDNPDHYENSQLSEASITICVQAFLARANLIARWRDQRAFDYIRRALSCASQSHDKAFDLISDVFKVLRKIIPMFRFLPDFGQIIEQKLKAKRYETYWSARPSRYKKLLKEMMVDLPKNAEGIAAWQEAMSLLFSGNLTKKTGNPIVDRLVDRSLSCGDLNILFPDDLSLDELVKNLDVFSCHQTAIYMLKNALTYCPDSKTTAEREKLVSTAEIIKKDVKPFINNNPSDGDVQYTLAILAFIDYRILQSTPDAKDHSKEQLLTDYFNHMKAAADSGHGIACHTLLQFSHGDIKGQHLDHAPFEISSESGEMQYLRSLAKTIPEEETMKYWDNAMRDPSVPRCTFLSFVIYYRERPDEVYARLGTIHHSAQELYLLGRTFCTGGTLQLNLAVNPQNNFRNEIEIKAEPTMDHQEITASITGYSGCPDRHVTIPIKKDEKQAENYFRRALLQVMDEGVFCRFALKGLAHFYLQIRKDGKKTEKYLSMAADYLTSDVGKNLGAERDQLLAEIISFFETGDKDHVVKPNPELAKRYRNIAHSAPADPGDSKKLGR